MCVFLRLRIAFFGELFPCGLFRTHGRNARADQMPQLRRDFITAGVRVRKGGQNTQVPQPMAPTVLFGRCFLRLLVLEESPLQTNGGAFCWLARLKVLLLLPPG